MTRKELLPSGSRPPKFSEKRQALFLKMFSKCNSIVQACKAADISSTTVYKELKKQGGFALQFEAANDLVLDNLEAEAYRRGVTGVKKAIYFQGRLVGHELVYSDKMLEMLLRGRSDKYSNKTSVEVSGKVDHNIDVTDIRSKILEKALSRGITFDNEEAQDAEFEDVEKTSQDEGKGDPDE